jgi:hypothetical protein
MVMEEGVESNVDFWFILSSGEVSGEIKKISRGGQLLEICKY